MTDTARMPLEEFVPPKSIQLKDYEPFIGEHGVQELERLAAPLTGKGWANVNSTFVGGGVAEMLRGLIPMARACGIDARWFVMQGDERFFGVTKKFHNLLQGMELDISLEEIFHAYLDTIDRNACETFITSDLVVVHDPQPAALVMNGVIYGNVLWRCHIDTSKPDKTIWRFLLPYINHCAGAIFTMPEFVGPGLQVPAYQVMPGIDPLAEKNRLRSREEALDILAPLLNEHDIDPDRPILASVSRYDPHKNQAAAIRAFKQMRRDHPMDPAPYLIFLGNTAADDPEGDSVLQHLRELAGDDPDIRFLVNVEDNDRVVGALLNIARGFVHAATREGFGLVVTEALWQRTPVIGADVGGIRAQVIDGETGYLVDVDDDSKWAEAMARLLLDDDACTEMCAGAQECVRRHFLTPNVMRRYLQLMRYYSRVDRQAPGFRLSDLTYSEVINAMRPRPPFFP